MHSRSPLLLCRRKIHQHLLQNLHLHQFHHHSRHGDLLYFDGKEGHHHHRHHHHLPITTLCMAPCSLQSPLSCHSSGATVGGVLKESESLWCTSWASLASPGTGSARMFSRQRTLKQNTVKRAVSLLCRLTLIHRVQRLRDVV